MKRIYWIWVLLVGVFWEGNFFVTILALSHPIVILGITLLGLEMKWSVLVVILFALVDVGMVLDTYKPFKEGGEEPVFNLWLLMSFLNTLLICWAVVLILHTGLVLTVLAGAVYFFMRVGVFILIPFLLPN